MDHATSTDPAVQAQLDRLATLSPGADILGLERITALLARLGDPHLAMPPVFHVAGTNGKGSTCAFLRAAIEAAGYKVHVYSSPHLVRFNERIRIAGRLVDDAMLAGLLAEVLDVADDIAPSFFEVTTAAAFLAFGRHPAAATIVEVGLGGRLDATNVVAPVVTGIAALGMDHETFLGDRLIGIAGEKAGIAKRGVPLVTMDYARPLRSRIAAVAAAAGAPVIARKRDWSSETARSTMRYTDPGFSVVTHRPRLVGAHQSRNLALAIAMVRHQGAMDIPEAAMRAAADWAHWPARMQRLAPGPLVDRLPAGSAVWLDGAHNPSAAIPVAKALRRVSQGAATLVLGMLANKDATGVLRALAPGLRDAIAVPVPGHLHHAPDMLAGVARSFGLAAGTAASVADAIDRIGGAGEPRCVLVAGSLYLAGDTLRFNDQVPD
ncbi:bifunctional folylpolyglutamate synthase/dihydrofolate synthase [uncultured Sphingomonas sp.]|uniref:bifunctional folylpolyglutamate synthase/dihydrofolate synthase n=1 Tax=uncultured Sphingomonas sp. TaxID=158754 RepID=UPI0035CA25EE